MPLSPVSRSPTCCCVSRNGTRRPPPPWARCSPSSGCRPRSPATRPLGITTAEDLAITAVVHQANISVDEAGTEAAAATAVVAGATSARSRWWN